MLGGMLAFFFMQSGVPMPLAILLAIAIPAVVGMLLEKLAIESARAADVVTLIRSSVAGSLPPASSVCKATRHWRRAGARR